MDIHKQYLVLFLFKIYNIYNKKRIGRNVVNSSNINNVDLIRNNEIGYWD